MKKILILTCLGMFLTVACSQTGTPPSKAPKHSKDAGQDKPLLIGLMPEQQIFAQMKRYEPLAEFLSKRIGRKVKLEILPEYGNIVDSFESAGMDGAFFGSFAYVLAHAKLGVEVLARPEYNNGVSTYHGLIFVRKDSGIRTSGDMKGKRLALVDKATTAGYLLPLAYFKGAGIRDYRKYFAEVYFTGTHEDAILDVLNGRADVGAAKNTIYSWLAVGDGRVVKDLVVLARSLDVPENGLAVRRNLDPAVREKLRETLLGMRDDPVGRDVLREFGAARFIQTTDADYAHVVVLAREAGLDPATYSYTNE